MKMEIANIIITDRIQATASIITAFAAVFGLVQTLPKMKNDLDKSANERLDKFEQQMREHIRGYSDEAALDQWKRLVALFTNKKELHEYSNLDGNTTKSD